MPWRYKRILCFLKAPKVSQFVSSCGKLVSCLSEQLRVLRVLAYVPAPGEKRSETGPC